MNIDISLESTQLSFSILDENGLTKEIWDHNDFMTGTSLRSLSSFFSFSEVTTLTVKKYFFYLLRSITFVEKRVSSDIIHFLGLLNKELIENKNAAVTKDATAKKVLLKCIAFSKKQLIGNKFLFSGDKDPRDKHIVKEIKDILRGETPEETTLVSIQQQKYIKTFIRIYILYISEVVLSKLSSFIESNVDIKIGYAVTIEKILLEKLFGTEDNLRDIIYASGLIRKGDRFKKLRIITQGEGILPLIQQSYELEFSINSFFVLAQLHESYIQLTLNRVVTASDSNEDGSESIITQDKIIHIPSIHDSFCLKMWNNIMADSTLIQLCDTHIKNDAIELLELFSTKNLEKFKKNLRNYISKQVLGKNSVVQYTDQTTIYISTSCICSVRITISDIIDISFRPVLQEVISAVYTSLINKQLFREYRNIEYIFHMICFNYNPWFQPIFMKILEDENNQFMYDKRIDTPCYVIPKLWNQILQPVLKQRPLLYKVFRVGVLHQVFSKSYGFSFDHIFFNQLSHNTNRHFNYRYKSSDTKTISFDNKSVFLLFKKGDKISTQTKRIFNLSLKSATLRGRFGIQYFKMRNLDNLGFDEIYSFDHTSEKIEGPQIGGPFDNIGSELPVVISIVYEGYPSSFSLSTKVVGDEMEPYNIIRPAEPTTLARF
ncbi:hypothetical protein BDF21DRAFT_423299 [Thamnidium elegans]|nr:hypothetical protein BDF21DRAFT_423299 [Thamnidium elegans]